MGADTAGMLMVQLGPLPTAVIVYRSVGTCNQDVVGIGGFGATATSANFSGIGFAAFPGDFAQYVTADVDVGTSGGAPNLDLQSASDFLTAPRRGRVDRIRPVWGSDLTDCQNEARFGGPPLVSSPVRTPPRPEPMDFDDTPEEAAFRTECRAWLEENASLKPQTGSADLWRLMRPRTEEDDRIGLETAKVWQGTKAEAGLRRDPLAGRVRRPRALPSPRRHLQDGGAPLRGAGQHLPGRRRHGRPHADRPRQRDPAAPLPRRHPSRQGGVVPALQRARSRLRPRRPVDERRSRRRRVRGERPEGVDLGRAQLGLGDPPRADRPRRPQAPGHLVPAGRHVDAGHRGAPAPPDRRRDPLQRGVLHRRPRAGGQPGRPGERRLAGGDDHPDQRAHGHRRRWDGLVRRHPAPGPRSGRDPAIRPPGSA